MAGNSRNRRKKKNSTGRLYVVIIAMFMLIVMSVQIVRLYIKDQGYKETQENLQSQVQDAIDKQDELAEKEKEVQSEEYIEDEARDKLGLVHENEIIFRENK